VTGKPGVISVRSFLTVVESAFRVLADLDVAISRDQKGTLDWVVTDLGIGSLMMEAQARPRREDKNIGPEVTEAFVSGLRLVETAGTSPPFLSDTGMRTTQRMLRPIGRDGATGIEVSNLRESTMLTTEAIANIAELIPERQRSLGAVEGKLETISVRGGHPKFTIYLSRTNKAVACRIPEGMLLEEAKQTLGKRVLVTGIVRSNARGEPLSVEAEHIRAFRAPDQLPKTRNLHGIDPNFTGGLSSDEYVRALRDA